MSNMAWRIISSLLIGPLFIVAILGVPLLFRMIMLMIAAVMLLEWHEMTKSSVIDWLSGLVIIPLPIMSLILISFKDHQWLLMTYFVTIWSVDIGAMIGGKNFKGPKLARRISPNKTWSGLITGIITAGMSAFCLAKVPGFKINLALLQATKLVPASMLIALLAQLSDLYISAFKRKFSIKDSGSFIPGHGGMLDRFDSIILTAPLLWLVT